MPESASPAWFWCTPCCKPQTVNATFVTENVVMIFRPMPVLTVFSLTALVVLIVLGNWQYTRYRGKSLSVLASDAPAPKWLEINIDHGRPGNAQQVYGLVDGEPVWRIYAPGHLAGPDYLIETGPPVLVLVGVTGGSRKTPQTITSLPERIAFQGNLLQHEDTRQPFSLADKPKNDTWYRFNTRGIADRLGLQTFAPDVAEPLQLVIRNNADPSRKRITANPYAHGRPRDPLPPERHFGYALTWWGMALGLAGVYIGLHRARGRLRFRKA